MTTRAALVSELRHRLERHGSPRRTVLVILTLAGGAAFLGSVLALAAGVESMALRYGLSVLAGYVAFILMIRIWIRLRQREWGPEELLDAANVVGPSPWPPPMPSPDLFAGGRSGGAGGGSAWAPATGGRPLPMSGSHSAVLSDGMKVEGLEPYGMEVDGAQVAGSFLDLEDLGWIVVALLVAAGGVVCLSYVIYTAPVLLAEVALDAALVSTVYRRLRAQDAGHWSLAVLRRTWLPAAGLALFVSVLGFALQQIVPQARTIGGVIRALVG